MKSLLRRFILTAFIFTLLGMALAAGEYALEYGVISAGGSASQTSDYEVVDLLVSTGLSGETQDTGTYLIEPLVGLSEEAPSSVDDWILH